MAWLELREARPHSDYALAEVTDQPRLSPEIRKVFTNPLILNQDYSQKEAEEAVETGRADAISFGRLFISNPDLVRRFRGNLPLQKADMATWAWSTSWDQRIYRLPFCHLKIRKTHHLMFRRLSLTGEASLADIFIVGNIRDSLTGCMQEQEGSRHNGHQNRTFSFS